MSKQEQVQDAATARTSPGCRKHEQNKVKAQQNNKRAHVTPFLL